MPCPKAVHGRHRRRVNWLLAHPATVAARHSRLLRRHLDNHGWITPNFSWAEMADTGGTPVPTSLRANAVRHCWQLERFSRALGKARRRGRGKRVAVTIDGPFRTPAHNAAIGGATASQHMQADASDHFVQQVERWMRETGLSRNTVIALAARYFVAIGNESSNTLHFDSRPGRPGSVRFVHWAGERR